ncbi:MAG TPA: hypothetical protein DCM08_12470 [Microscillaceae bacterium]|jgi:hypothetical protein|nr:hypothetical protein [Microscillaceae bacterium]
MNANTSLSQTLAFPLFLILTLTVCQPACAQRFKDQSLKSSIKWAKDQEKKEFALQKQRDGLTKAEMQMRNEQKNLAKQRTKHQKMSQGLTKFEQNRRKAYLKNAKRK